MVLVGSRWNLSVLVSCGVGSFVRSLGGCTRPLCHCIATAAEEEEEEEERCSDNKSSPHM